MEVLIWVEELEAKVIMVEMEHILGLLGLSVVVEEVLVLLEETHHLLELGQLAVEVMVFQILSLEQLLIMLVEVLVMVLLLEVVDLVVADLPLRTEQLILVEEVVVGMELGPLETVVLV